MLFPLEIFQFNGKFLYGKWRETRTIIFGLPQPSNAISGNILCMCVCVSVLEFYLPPLVPFFILICILGPRRGWGLVFFFLGSKFVTIQSGDCFPFCFFFEIRDSGALINKYEHKITFGPRGEKAGIHSITRKVKFSFPFVSFLLFSPPNQQQFTFTLTSDAHMRKMRKIKREMRGGGKSQELRESKNVIWIFVALFHFSFGQFANLHKGVVAAAVKQINS